MVERGAGWPGKAPALALFVLVTVVFAWTVWLRLPWFGQLSEARHNSGTAHALIAAHHWYDEGAVKLHFGWIWAYPSVEFASLKERGIYGSYGPGALLPVHAVALIAGERPTAGMLMGLALLSHGGLALLCGLIPLVFLAQVGFPSRCAFVLALTSSLVLLLNPASLYWHGLTFGVDQWVILPFVAFVGLEALRPNVPGSRLHWLAGAQDVILFYGTLTEWLFLPVALVAYLLRWLSGGLTTSPGLVPWVCATIRYAAAPALALGLFVWQRAALEGFGPLIQKAVERTGLSNAMGFGSIDLALKALAHLRANFGTVGAVLIVGSIVTVGALSVEALVRLHRGQAKFCVRPLAVLAGLLILPPILLSVLLKQHLFHHDFVVLKLETTLSMVTFAVLPAMLASRFATHGRTRGATARLFTMASVLVAAAYLSSSHQKFYVEVPKPNQALAEIGEFLRQNTGPRDVVVSREYEIKPCCPPVQYALSEKEVYRLGDGGLEALLPRLEGQDYRLLCLLLSGTADGLDSNVVASAPLGPSFGESMGRYANFTGSPLFNKAARIERPRLLLLRAGRLAKEAGRAGTADGCPS